MDNGPDKRLVRASFERASEGYDATAVLQSEVRDRLLERLDLVRLDPAWVLDAGAGTGRGAVDLSLRYRRARVVALDLSGGMLRRARDRFNPLTRRLRGHGFIAGDIERLPFADATFDLVFSNLALQWCTDLENTFHGLRRILRPGGLLLFSTFGPDTLKELRTAWSRVDGNVHVNRFVDMHDVGDAMLNARLADPVMDMERITLTYSEVAGLMRDLKAIGAHNVNAGRPPGLTGKARLSALVDAYEGFRQTDGRLPATYEVVYGHAWAPEGIPQQHTKAGTTGIRFDQLRGMLRR